MLIEDFLLFYAEGEGREVPPKRRYISIKLQGQVQRTVTCVLTAVMVSYRETFRLCGVGTARCNIMQIESRLEGVAAAWPWVHDIAFCDILINFVPGSIIPGLKCAVVEAEVVGR
jgi:hypothetical protein